MLLILFGNCLFIGLIAGSVKSMVGGLLLLVIFGCWSVSFGIVGVRGLLLVRMWVLRQDKQMY